MAIITKDDIKKKGATAKERRGMGSTLNNSGSILTYMIPIQRLSSRRKMSNISSGDAEADVWNDYGFNNEEDDNDITYDIVDVTEVGAPSVPDGGYGWVIVFASFMCNLIVDGIANSFSLFLPSLSESLNADKGSVAWANSLLCGILLFVGPLVSSLTNKFGCRTVCITGSIIAATGFALSSLSPSLGVLILTYGVIGGVGFGFIYLPAVVCVGYYFETKRAFATGIAVCGTGVGTIVFAQISNLLLQHLSWRHVHLIYAVIILICAALGTLMKPLEVQIQTLDDDDNEDIEESLQNKPEDKQNSMDKGSLAGSAYFMVQLPDGTMERRLKMPLNVDPGVHSNFHLDQLVPGTPITPVPTLPTIAEAKAMESTNRPGYSAGKEFKTSDADPIQGSSGTNKRNRSRRNSEGIVSSSASRTFNQGTPTDSSKDKEAIINRTPSKQVVDRAGNSIGGKGGHGSIIRNGSAPHFNYSRGVSKNGSVPVVNQMQRKHSFKAVPLGSAQPINKSSKLNLQERRRSSMKNSVLSSVSSKPRMNSQDEDYSSMWNRQELDELIFSTSTRTQTAEPRHILRPMSRKDIFYSGSIIGNLSENHSLNNYRHSILNLPKVDSKEDDSLDPELAPEKVKQSRCRCLGPGAGAFKSTLSQMMDFSLMKNPVFLFIAVSNIFGMLGFYVPIVFIASAAMQNLNVDQSKAAFLVSVMGITNTIGRIASGLLSDLPQVNSLFMNNVCVLVSGILIAILPSVSSYIGYVVLIAFFGLIISGYISLTSIILVDLLGIDNLTNAFGLLILFRGGASILGAPLAGALYEKFQTYDIPFWLAGGFFVISALISFLIPFVK